MALVFTFFSRTHESSGSPIEERKLIATKKPLAIIALAFIGVLAVLQATRFGIGITPDSTVYVGAARSFPDLVALTAAGEVKPLVHYPPLYSSALGVISAIGLPIESAARWLNALLFGANILLVGLALAKYAKGSFWLPVLGSFLTLTAPDLAGIHTFALTEPLFLFFALAGFIALAAYLDNQRPVLLFLAAFAVAAAFLTRYVGVVLVFTGTVALLSLKGRTVRRRLAEAITFAAVACLPNALWAFRQVAADTTDRALVFHPIKLGQIVSGISTMSSWLLLGKVRGDIRAIGFLIEVVFIAAIVAYLFVAEARPLGRAQKRTIAAALSSNRYDILTNGRESLQKLPHILSIYILSNLGFLIFAASFIDADTVLDDRSLVVVHVAALILILILAWRLYRSSTLTRNMRIGFVILALVFAGSYGLRAARWFERTRRDGQGYASRQWQESETIARVRLLPSGAPIYSNGYDAIYYLTGQPALYLPEKVIHGTGQANQNYRSELDRMQRDLREHQGVVVYFNTLPERWFLPSESELKMQVQLIATDTAKDGSIYEATLK